MNGTKTSYDKSMFVIWVNDIITSLYAYGQLMVLHIIKLINDAFYAPMMMFVSLFFCK